MKKLTCLITLFLFISVGYINAETMASRKKIKMKVETSTINVLCPHLVPQKLLSAEIRLILFSEKQIKLQLSQL